MFACIILFIHCTNLTFPDFSTQRFLIIIIIGLSLQKKPNNYNDESKTTTINGIFDADICRKWTDKCSTDYPVG